MNKLTRQELQQYFYLNREIRFLQDELKTVKNRYKKTKHANTPELEVLAIKGEILRGKIRQCETLTNRIEEFVNSIDDSLTRQIFYYRYIKFMTWRKVSSMVGGYLSEDGARKITERYLSN